VVAHPSKSAIGGRKVAASPARDIRLPLSVPVRVQPAPRAAAPARPMPMPVSIDRPAAPVQLRQPRLFGRELPSSDDTN
jgi:hypothetical protein